MNLEVRQAMEIEAMAKEFDNRSGIRFDTKKIVCAFDKIMGDYDHDIMQPKYDFETEEGKQTRYYDKALRAYKNTYKMGLADVIREGSKEGNKTSVSQHSLELYDDLMTKAFEILFPNIEEKSYAMGGMDKHEYRDVFYGNVKTTRASELLKEFKENDNYCSEYITNQLFFQNEEISNNPKSGVTPVKNLASLYIVAKEHFEKKNFFSKYFTSKGLHEHKELKRAEGILSYKSKELGVSKDTLVSIYDKLNPSMESRSLCHALKNVDSRFEDSSYRNEENEMTKARDKAEERYYNALFPKKEEALREAKPVTQAINDTEPEQLSVDLGENNETVPFETSVIREDPMEYAPELD